MYSPLMTGFFAFLPTWELHPTVFFALPQLSEPNMALDMNAVPAKNSTSCMQTVPGEGWPRRRLHHNCIFASNKTKLPISPARDFFLLFHKFGLSFHSIFVPIPILGICDLPYVWRRSASPVEPTPGNISSEFAPPPRRNIHSVLVLLGTLCIDLPSLK